jgi:CBS domain-containing protein
VTSLRPQVPAHAAAGLLVSHGFTGAPVVDVDERVIGIATEADLVRGRITAEGGSTEERPEPTVADRRLPSSCPPPDVRSGALPAARATVQRASGAFQRRTALSVPGPGRTERAVRCGGAGRSTRDSGGRDTGGLL